MNKTTEALKLAEEALVGYRDNQHIKAPRKTLAAIRKALADAFAASGKPIAEPVKRPQNCGTGYCSCIECIYGKDGCVADDEQCNDGCLARESTIADALKLADEIDGEFCRGRISNHNGRKAAQMIRLLVDAPVQPVKQEPVAHKWPLMGYGNVAIGGCKQPDGTSGLVYMDMGETREIDADTTDLFPVGSEADPSKLLACIYFKDGSAIQQTIDVLREMQIEIGYAAPVQPVKQEPVAWMYCPECGSLDVRYEDGNHKQCASCAQEWFSDIDYSDVVQQNLNRLHAALVDAKAIRAEALEEAAKWFEANGANMMTKDECAAGIRGLK